METQGEDGVSTGHFVLLQSWLPIEENLEKRMPFPFGVGACSTSTVHQSPDSSASASASTPLAEQHQPEASATAAMEPSVASNASATKANVHRLLSQEQTQTVQSTKRNIRIFKKAVPVFQNLDGLQQRKQQQMRHCLMTSSQNSVVHMQSSQQRRRMGLQRRYNK